MNRRKQRRYCLTLCSLLPVSTMLMVAANAAGPIYTVRTSAMEPTFLIGDHVLAPGGEHVGDLRRGDVIVFHYPPDPEVVIIKRLIGLPGGHIRIINGVLVVNSRRVSEPYIQHSAGASVSRFFNNFPDYADKDPSVLSGGRKMLDRYAASGELLIPEGGYFVLGDSRDDSSDSRSWGLLQSSQIIGLVHEILSSDDPKTNAPRTDRVHVPVQRGSFK